MEMKIVIDEFSDFDFRFKNGLILIDSSFFEIQKNEDFYNLKNEDSNIYRWIQLSLDLFSGISKRFIGDLIVPLV